MSNVYSGTASSSPPASAQTWRKRRTASDGKGSRSGLKCGSARGESSMVTARPSRAAALAAARSAAALIELRRRLPGIARITCVLLDLLACRGERVPAGAEVLSALAVRLARLCVEREAVEGVTRVGDLPCSVRAADDAKQRALYSRTCRRLAVREKRRPVGSAGAC